MHNIINIKERLKCDVPRKKIWNAFYVFLWFSVTSSSYIIHTAFRLHRKSYASAINAGAFIYASLIPNYEMFYAVIKMLIKFTI